MTLAYLLDTDTVSYALRGVGAVADHILARQPSELAISSITLAELRFVAQKCKSKRLHALIDAFVGPVRPLPFDELAASAFGKLAANLAMKGTPIGNLDTLIAAHALSLDLTLVTNHTRHFGHVTGLRIENWA